MRRCVGVLMLCTFLLTFGATVNADSTWVPGNVGNWSDSANWTGTTPPANPSTETINIASGTATLNVNQQSGILRMDGTAGATGTLNITTGSNLTLYKTGSTELLRGSATATGTGIVNHSAGTVTVYNGVGTGEVRLSGVAGAIGTYNLSGTGILDVEYLNKGDKTRPGTFNGNGGTLLVRNYISKWGSATELAGYGFNLGATTLEVASWATRSSEVGNVLLGQGQNMDFFMNSTSALKLDLGSAAGVAGTDWDLLNSRGNFIVDGVLLIDFLVAPTLGDYWDVWKMQVGFENTFSGSGSFDTLPSNIVASWVDTGAGTDTLRLTYVPEPATIALLGLGLIALRRNKK